MPVFKNNTSSVTVLGSDVFYSWMKAAKNLPSAVYGGLTTAEYMLYVQILLNLELFKIRYKCHHCKSYNNIHKFN